MNDADKEFLRLLLRSPDEGDGWRSFSKTLWPLVSMFESPDLLEIDKPGMRGRLTEDAKSIVPLML